MADKEKADGPVQINIQVPFDIREDFRIVAANRGFSMSNMLFQYILKVVREAKAETPEIFPDYNPPPKIVSETGMDEILYEALEGKELTPEMRRTIEIAVKTALKVKELNDEGEK